MIEFDPDVVHFDSLHTASYAAMVRKLAPRSLRVLRCHNAEYVILERLAQSQANPLKRWIFGIQAKRLKAYEGRQLDKFDLILAITAEDAARFASVNPGSASRTVVVPAGADLPQEMPAAAPMRDELVRIVHIRGHGLVAQPVGTPMVSDLKLSRNSTRVTSGITSMS